MLGLVITLLVIALIAGDWRALSSHAEQMRKMRRLFLATS